MKRKLLIQKFSVLMMLLFMGVYSYAQSNIFISEVADPADNYAGRFVQLYNPTNAAVDLGAENWHLVKQANGGSYYDVPLTGTIASGGTFVIAGYSDFSSIYGFDANMTNSSVNGNGDDGYFLYKGGDESSGTLIDAYGVIDEDGTGQAWEYTDGKAVRNSDVDSPDTTWTASEWTITRPANVADMDPANHVCNPGPPKWTTGYPQAVHVEDTRGTFLVNMDIPGKVYFIIVPPGSDAPTAAQVKAGVNYGSVTVLANDSITVSSGNTTVAYEFTGAKPNSTADIWFVAENNAGDLQTDPVKLTVTTTGSRSLTLDNPLPHDSFNLGDTIDIQWTAANIDSLLIGVYPVAEGISHAFVIVDQPVAASVGYYKVKIPYDAEPGDMGIVLWDYYDTTFKATVDPITIVDNRSLTLTEPQDNDTVYVGDTMVFRWTSQNVDSVLIGGYIGVGGPDNGYFMLTGDPDHFDTASFQAIPAAPGVWKIYLDPKDVGGGIKLDSVIIWDAADMRLKSYASPVYLVDTFPLRITHTLPVPGMTDFMPNGWMYADFSCDSITRGKGNLYLKKSDGTIIETISADSIEIHGSSIDFSPTKALVPGQSYYIQIDSGFVKCVDDGKVFPGIQDKSWSFTVASSSLYFSEYIEGSGNNKALEIYNPTGNDISLDNYIIAGSHDGSGIDDDEDVYHFPQGYVLKAGKVFVLANSGADSCILEKANDILAYNEGGYVCSFNGNDARVLIKVVNNGDDYMWIDEIGEPWDNPGSGWTVAGVENATKDHTLLRKTTVKMGTVNWNMSAGTDADNSEWIVKPENYCDNLGLPTSAVNGINVTFNVDMSYAKKIYPDFDPTKDSVFIAGTFPDATWNEPGTNHNLRMSDADSNLIYTITIHFTEAQHVEYKYFLNAGWSGGEWQGGDNRKVDIATDTTLNDIFGNISNTVTVGVPFMEDFEKINDGDAIAIPGWINTNTQNGQILWLGRSYNDNKYAQVSAYKSPTKGPDEVWMITPGINMDSTTAESLSFDVNVAYWKHNGLRVMVSTDFDGKAEDISKATWTDITSQFTIPTSPTDGYGKFAPAGKADVSSYNGIMYVAFVYDGDVTKGETTTYQIDNVSVVGSTTGINNVALSDKVQLFPNPGNGIFRIALNNTLKGAVSLKIVDVTGRLIMQRRYDQVTGPIRVNISSQPSNLYFITISDATHTIVKKFMKQ